MTNMKSIHVITRARELTIRNQQGSSQNLFVKLTSRHIEEKKRHLKIDTMAVDDMNQPQSIS